MKYSKKHPENLKKNDNLLQNNFTVVSLFISGCFFLSGAAGLIYEVLWVRMIEKVIGSAPFSVAAVLSIFMGGLALGGYLAGKYVDRFKSRIALLAFYGKIEICVGIYALLLPFLIAAVTPLYQIIYDPLLNHFWCYQAISFLGCAILLIIPTCLMGATLPVLCRFYVSHLSHIGGRTGWLYGLNTVGAALGSVLCGFVLVKNLGVLQSLGIGAAINILVGASCLLLSKTKLIINETKPGKDKFSVSEKRFVGDFAEDNSHRLQMKWALCIFAVSGFCSLSYEVIWTRLLGLIAGPTTYSFTLVISTFIIGLALGSIIFGQIADKIKRVFLLLVITQLCASALALIVSQVLGNSQFLFAKLIHTFNSSYSTMIVIQSMVIFVILLGPTVFMGAAFPIVNRIYIRSMHDLGKSLGTAYALNTIGAILGSIAAGYFMIPLIGKENGLRIIIMLQFVTAALAFTSVSTSGFRRYKETVAGIGLIVCCILLIFHFPSWQGDLLSRGWYRDLRDIEHELDRTDWTKALWNGNDLLSKQREGIDVVFYGEGIGGFTTVEKEITSIGTIEYAMFNSGKADASSHGDRSTQTLSAHIPMLFHPNAKNVMVLGLASGMTSGEVLLYPVEKLDIVEINEQVVKACRLYFTEWNNDCLSDPRTRLIVQDGRNHLALTREKYDVIISEPSNPWMAGLASLYTAEFFQMVRNRLNEKGIFAQWIQSYEMDWDTFCLLGRTFAKAFPNASLIKIGPADYMLLGFMDEKGFDWPVAQKNFRYAGKSGYVTFPGLNFLVHLIMTEDLQALFGPGHVHTDNRPILEFSAPMKLYSGSLNIDKAVAGKRRISSNTLRMLKTNSDYNTMLDLNEFFVSANVPAFDMVKWQNLNLEQKGRYKNAVLRYCSLVQVPSYNRFDNTDLKRCCAELQIDRIRQRQSAKGLRTVDHYNLGLALIAAGQEDEAAGEFRTTIRLDPWHEKGYIALGLLLAKCGKLDEAAQCFLRILEMSPKKAEPYKYLGMIDLRRGELKSAVSNLSEALKLQPDDPEILNELGFAYFNRHDYNKTVESFLKVLAQNPIDADAHHNIALAYKCLGDQQKAGEHFLAAAQIDSGKDKR